MRRAEEVRLVLHALVIGHGNVPRALLYERLHTASGNLEDRHNLSNYLSELRNKHKIPVESSVDPVCLKQSEMSVDLWEFLDLVEQEPPRIQEARELLRKGDIRFFSGDESDFEEWTATVEAFERGKQLVLNSPSAPESPATAYVQETKQRLLDRKVVPGVIDEQRVRNVQDTLGRIKAMQTMHGKAEVPRAAVLADRLEGKSESRPRIVMTGRQGAGKEITAVMVYLELAERFERDPDPKFVPIFVDAMSNGYEKGFNSQKWFKGLLRDAGVGEDQEPILVVPHADAYLAPKDDLRKALQGGLFRAKHLLICCTTNFYEMRLRHRDKDLEAEEEVLVPWRRSFQEDFAQALLDPESAAEFSRWLDENRTREELCEVPLHLVYVLSLLQGEAEGSARLERVSHPIELLKTVARMRLERTLSEGFDVDECLELLGAVSHRYSRGAKAAAASPIQFTHADLKRQLTQMKDELQHTPRHWAEELEQHTLLIPSGSSGTLAFEHPIWGPFFVAEHIVSTLQDRPEQSLRAFSNFLSAEVSGICEELLEAAAAVDPDALRRALRTAIENEDPDLPAARIRIAREQVCYFFGVIQHEGMRSELFRFVEVGSPDREEDPLIRRAILFGLADGGCVRAADMYVDRLREEREAGETLERDTNIGFHLTFRGDQRFDLDHPDAIGRNARCIRTVAALIRGLEQSEHRGSRRIKLFTLLDLAQNPKVDHDCFRAEMGKNAESLQEIRKDLGKRKSSRDWPELQELDELLAELRTSGN
jgi:hypothetical protein